MPWTVQKLIDDEMTVTAYCHRSSCNHYARIDLDVLKARLGPDAEAMADDLIPKLRCKACGGKKLGLIYTPPSDPAHYRNRYAKAKGL